MMLGSTSTRFLSALSVSTWELGIWRVVCIYLAQG